MDKLIDWLVEAIGRRLNRSLVQPIWGPLVRTVVIVLLCLALGLPMAFSGVALLGLLMQ